MKFVIIGQGGHGKVINDMVLTHDENEIVGYLDDKYEKTTVQNNVFYSPISTAKAMVKNFKDLKFIIAIGDNSKRKQIAHKLQLLDECYATLIHKTAVVSPNAVIGFGTVVMPNAVINAGSQIGKHAIINTGAVVEHDCKLDDFVHISPNAALTGGVQIEEGSSVGAGAAIIPNASVGKWSVIGAGATVITDIPSHCTAVGNPARVKSKQEVK